MNESRPGGERVCYSLGLAWKTGEAGGGNWKGCRRIMRRGHRSPCPNVDDKFAFVHEAWVGGRTKTEAARFLLRSSLCWNVATLEINYIIPFFRNIVKRERVGERNRETDQPIPSLHASTGDRFDFPRRFLNFSDSFSLRHTFSTIVQRCQK